MSVPAQLPEARRRSSRGGPELCTISLDVEVVTPILSGGSQTRALDDVDVIRAATVRGHLRFWWRALRGHEFASSEQLHEDESALWGRASADRSGRAAIEVRIDDGIGGQIDESQIDPNRIDAYALWPARRPPAPRRRPGTRFRLTLLTPSNREGELRNVLRAWLLFGGYGSRTRRGLGSFRVTQDVTAWLPRNATGASLGALFGSNILASSSKAPVDVPWLAGAALQLGTLERDALKAWTTALDWLKTFRQGPSGGSGDRAREPGTGKLQPSRHSIANWPEADKVRHLRLPDQQSAS